ncbi:MAG TPA: VOC family protein [Candidatus Acidoferrales bacterium]|nr:VOC family protein [Candidatus Acidoferrales bacterium]
MRRASERPRQAAAPLQFHHALIYVADVERSLRFYQGHLGFKLIDSQVLEGVLVYARMRLPAGKGTLALHRAERDPGVPFSGGVRLYFETKDVDRLCKRLAAAGVEFDQPSKRMPWGWIHAYLKDPDGHELSLFWAGAARLRKSRAV